MRPAMSATFSYLEPLRSRKGCAGRVAVWGGSALYCGAPYFSSQAALNLGADMVFLKAGHHSVVAAIKNRSPDIMTEHKGFGEATYDSLDESDKSIIGRCHALLIGPGINTCIEKSNGVLKSEVKG